MPRIAGTLAIWFLMMTAVGAAEFYVDPDHGDSANDGSAANPWRSVQEILDAGLVESRAWDSLPHKPDSKLVPKHPGAPVKAGDTIWLRSGYHGALLIQDYYNAGIITITAQAAHTPRFRSVRVRSGSHWALKGLHVSPEYGDGPKPDTLVALEAHGWRGPIHDVAVRDCVLWSADDTSDWSAEDWNTRACNGISVDGTRMTVRSNRLKNVNFGISVDASHSWVEHNTVENFAGDGLRGLGNHTVFQYNLVKNCYDVNANHDDGFQSWSRGPQGVGKSEVVGIVLRGNTIINYEDPAQPHRGALQGIGCFDGMFVDWVVENNVIMVDHWHGITLLGARGCRVVNNTVIDLNNERPGPPGVRIAAHKDGTPSAGCVVRNNLTPSLSVSAGADTSADHNLIFDSPTSIFADVSRHDLQLKTDSPAIDAGSQDQAPTVDILGIPRPQGRAFDVGAYEYRVR